MADQMVFKRYEFKYMMTEEQQHKLVQEMSAHMEADPHGRSTILSLYFDTPDYRLIRRSLEHPVYKEKLRLRSYGVADADTNVFVELKKKYDSVVYKRRISMKASEAEEYLLNGGEIGECQIKREIDYAMDFYRELRPMMLLSYEREAFYAKDDHEFRITFDRNILWRTENVNLHDRVYGSPLLKKNQVLMEVKVGGAMPLWFCKILTANKLYKTKFTKYGTAYETMLSMKKMEGDTNEYRKFIPGNIQHRHGINTGGIAVPDLHSRVARNRRVSGGRVRISK